MDGEEQEYSFTWVDGQLFGPSMNGNIVEWEVEGPEALETVNSSNSDNHLVEQLFQVNGSENFQTDAATSTSNLDEQTSQESLDVLKSYTDSNISQVLSSVVTTKAFNRQPNTLAYQMVDADTLCGNNVGNISFISKSEESEQRTEGDVMSKKNPVFYPSSRDSNIHWDSLSLPENILLVVHPIVKAESEHPPSELSLYFPFIQGEETRVSLYEVPWIQLENLIGNDSSLSNICEQIDFGGEEMEPTAPQVQNALMVADQDMPSIPWTRWIPEQMILCHHCGVCSEDLLFCIRCKSNLGLNTNFFNVPTSENTEKKSEEPETIVIELEETNKGKRQEDASSSDEPRSKLQKCDSQPDGVFNALLLKRILDLNISNNQPAVEESLQCSNLNVPLKKFPATEIISKTSLPGKSSQPAESIIIRLFSYQGITITNKDVLCLSNKRWLNDSILEFGLRYIEQEILSPEDRSRTHIFTTFFYKSLSTIKDDLNISNSQKRHNRVKRWTKNLDIFGKDFLIVPINEENHWFLAIICYPGLLGVHDMTTGEPIPNYKDEALKPKPLIKTEANSQLEAELNSNVDHSERQSNEKEEEAVVERQGGIKRPCILVLDSFNSLVEEFRTKVIETLREYLKEEYKTRKGEDREFSIFSMPDETIVVPQQPNDFDCGIYMLHYVQDFFQSPLLSFEMPINGGKMLFQENLNTQKREEIYNIVKALIIDPELLKLVPKLKFNWEVDEEEDMEIELESSSDSDSDSLSISSDASLESTTSLCHLDDDYASVPAE